MPTTLEQQTADRVVLRDAIGTVVEIILEDGKLIIRAPDLVLDADSIELRAETVRMVQKCPS